MATVKMVGNLFRGSRMNDVVLPGNGETVDLDVRSAAVLVERGYAEPVGVAETVEAAEKRGPGRPRRGA